MRSKFKTTKRYKCPYCDDRMLRADLISHVDDEHEDMIPKGYTSSRVVYNTINRKDHGTCMICKQETEWDDQKQRYNTICSKTSCKNEYVKIVRSRMVKKYGTDNLLKDPEFQKKILERRSISGKYKFEDGGSVGYVGSYEKKFLEFMDKFLHIKSYDIISPGPNIPYMYNGKEHIWITDFLYEPYNLVFDIKDGGSNPNTRDMKEYREKQIAKEKAIASYGDYNYLRLTDNNFEQLILMMMQLKESNEKVIMINESSIQSHIISENIEYVEENYVFNKKDLYINYNKFENGKSNVLLITGLSGSGKSTLGQKIANENNAEYIELDIFEHCYMFENNDQLKQAGMVFYDYLSSHKKIWNDLKNKNIKGKDLGNNIRNFVTYCINYCNKDKSNKYVIEGVQIYCMYQRDPKPIKKYPIIIKNTSALTSFIRMIKRTYKNDNENHDDIKDLISELPQCVAWYIDEEKSLNFFLKNLQETYIEESNYSNTNLYHLSKQNLDGKTLSPKVPSNFLVNNGYEDSTTKRVCFSASIDGCLRAMSQNLTGVKLYVHVPDKEYKIYKPSVSQVPDSKVTNEVWITENVKLKCIGIIEIKSDKGEDGIPYKYGNNKVAELYDWDWKWIQKYTKGE